MNMNRSQAIIVIFFVTALLSLTVLAACTMNTAAGAPTTAPTTTATVNAAAQQLLDTTCSRCHALSRVTTKSKTAEQWKITVDRMIKHGARLTADQEQML